MLKKVAILTTFKEFIPGYSLTGIVWDQFQLLRRKGHEVAVFVAEDYHGKRNPPEMRRMTNLIDRLIPKAKLVDYKDRLSMSNEHCAVSNRMADMAVGFLSNFDVVITHDLIFTGWNLPYAMGILKASGHMPKTRWLHWIHSIPSGFRDWWNLREYGNKHRLIYPNRTDLRRVAEQFRTEIEFCRAIPHPKDLRSWFDFDIMTCEFMDDFPGVMGADVVQIYPASTDRLEAKGVKDLILTFADIKRMGYSVCLVIANQHATGRQRGEDVSYYTKIASRNGLNSSEVVFTSNWKEGSYKEGIPKRMVRELMQCGNLFLFPTNHETFGLALTEAVLAGGVLPILNKSLGMMAEITGLNADYIDFGAFNNSVNRESRFHEAVARAVIGRLTRNESVMTKTYIRQRYNWNNLYKKYYMPIMEDSVNW